VSTPRDAEARRTAATRFDTNIAVLAGAGTGKTSLLVERILNAVGGGAATIDRIVAITFTQKAAGEMRERLAVGLERLARLAGGESGIGPDPSRAADRSYVWLGGEAGVEPERIRSRALEALARLDQARVETIHATCAAMLREHPIEAGVDPRFEVDQGERFETVLDDTWEAFVARELGPAGAREALWRRLLGQLSLEAVEEAARALAAFSVPAELLDPGQGGADPREPFVAEAGSLLAALSEVEVGTRQEGMAEGAERILRSAARALAGFLEGGFASLNAEVRNDPELAERLDDGSLALGRGLSGVEREEVRSLWKRLSRFLRGLLKVDEGLARDLLEAAAPFAREARESLLRRGYVGFDGLLALARDLLRDHPPVREILKQRTRMLLVDEFQDTDPLQYEIVLYLAEAEGGAAKDAYAATLGPGRLFVVGDAKQSIYRFRGADYTAFERAVGTIRGQGGLVLDLTANFRSVPEVVEPINRLFDGSAGGAWVASACQPAYVPIHAERRPAGSGPRVEVWTLDVDRALRAPERRAKEGEVVAEEIRRLVEDERALGFGQVSILLRAFTHVTPYLRALRARGVPFVVDGGREFLKRPEVGHLIALLRALVRPADQVALLAFLRSPAGGVPDTELAAYAGAGGRWSWFEEPDGSRWPALARAFETLRELGRVTRNLPADRVVQEALERTGLLLVSAAAFEGPQRVANLRKLAAAAGELARDGRLPLAEVIDALESERTADVEGDSPLADEGLDAVRVLTVHKAKGLENDLVIVPDLARQDRWGGLPGTQVHLFRREGSEAPVLALEHREFCNAAGLAYRNEERGHEEAEDVRVLYVALTRARERLVVVAGADSERASWLRALEPWGYRAAALPRGDGPLADGSVALRSIPPVRARSEDDLLVPAGSPGAVEAYDRAWEQLRSATRPPLRQPSGTREEDEARAEVGGLAGPPRELARLVGSVVHQALEGWDLREDAALVHQGRELARAGAGRCGLDVAAVEGEVAQILGRFVDSGPATELRRVEVLGREVAILYRDPDGTIWDGSLDLLYRDGSGRLVVADYKAEHDEDEATLRLRHGEQLRVYAEAVREAQQLDALPRQELWLLRSGRIVRLC
jgi:ATP-dependent helicase/nuclease subunit A